METDKSFGDREKLADLLGVQKVIAYRYNQSAAEVSDKALLTELLNLLYEEHQIRYECYEEMSKRGWCPVEPASPEQLQQVRNQYSQQ